MKHDFNGKRLSEVRLERAIAAIVVLPLNGWFPPLNASPAQVPAEMVRPLQQVTLRPDMFSAEGYLRLGHTPGDEASCWIDPNNVEIVEVLGAANWDGSTLKVDEEAPPREIREAA